MAEKSPWNSSLKAIVSKGKVKENNPGRFNFILQHGCLLYE